METRPQSKENLDGAMRTYKRLFTYILPYKKRFIVALVAALLAGCSSTLMMAVLTVVAKLILGVETNLKATVPFFGSVDLQPYLGWLIPVNGEWRTAFRVGVMCLFVPAFMGLRGFLDFFANYQRTWVEQRMTLDLRREVFGRIMARSLSFFNKERAANLMQTAAGMTATCANTATVIAQDLIRRPAAIISALVYLTYQDPIFMLCSLVVFPVCMLPVVLLRKKVKQFGKREQELSAGISGIMMESIAGIRIVKSHGRESYEVERFSEAARQMNSNAMRVFRIVEVVGPLVETAASLGIAGGLFYCWARGIGFEDFAFRVGLLVLLYPDAKALSRMQMLMHRCTVASDEVFKMLGEQPEIQDAPTAITVGRSTGLISFENVTHTYRAGAAPAVSGLSLKFEPGKFYALVGESGAGKSTIISLLMRFYDPQQGRITMDGVDIREITQASLREQIAIVNQDLFLFHDTIERNILYGRLGASSAEVREAARVARADDFIEKQPQGYQTVVGDKGCNLSGGQLQRVTIARAILRNSPISLLDEATSNLDTDTEKAFKDALKVLREGRTVIAIAHRFSTILEADQIVVMHQGQVVDCGTHAELLSRCASYERLYRLQFSVDEAVEEGATTSSSS